MDYTRIAPVLIEAASFIAAFAAIAAAIIIARTISKFSTENLTMGFRTVGIGIFILALGIVIDAVNTYIQPLQIPEAPSILLIVRQMFFVIGAYIILIGSKNMDIWLTNK